MLEVFLVGLIAFCFFAFNPQTNYYLPKYWFLQQIVICLLSYNVYLIGGLPFSLLIFYALSSVNYFTSLQFNHFFLRNPTLTVDFSGKVRHTFIASLALVIVYLFIGEHPIKLFIEASPLLLLIGTVYPLLPDKLRRMSIYRGVHVPFKKPPYDSRTHLTCAYFGYGSNPSVASSFLSVLAPVTLFTLEISDFYFYFTITTLILTFIAMVTMKASSGLGAFIASMLTFIAYKVGLTATLISIPCLIVSLYLINKYYFKGKLFDLSGRDDIIKFAWKHMKLRKVSMWIGHGVGSFAYLMPKLQRLKKSDLDTKGRHFAWAHCDFFQFFLEGGVIGAVLLALFMGHSLYLGYDNPAFMAFFVAWCCNSTTNFVNYLAPDSTICILMIKYLHVS